MYRLLFSPYGVILFSLCGFVSTCQGIREDNAFATQSKTALVQPFNYHTQTNYSKNGQATSISNLADISFKTEDGELITLHDRNLPSYILTQLTDGEQIKIQYLPKVPKTTRFPGEKIPTSTSFLGISALFLFLGIIWLLVRRNAQKRNA